MDSVDPENESEPHAEHCVHMAIQAGELSMVLMLIPHRFLYCMGTDVDALAYTMPKGLLSLAEVYDCPPGVEGRLWLQTELKSAWRPPHVLKHEVPKNLLQAVWCSCCNMGWASQRALTLSSPLGMPFVLWVLCTFLNSRCKCNSDLKGSAGSTSIYLPPFCQKDQLWVVLRYLGTLDESWINFSQVLMPKGIASKQMGMVLFYNMGKMFSSILHKT